MAYLDYEFTPSDTFYEIADDCNIPVSELLRINNIPQPITQTYIQDVVWPATTIKIPDILSGGESFENQPRNERPAPERPKEPKRESPQPVRSIGWKFQGQCYIEIDLIGTIYFPCMPESYSDSRQSNYTSQHPLGRSEPFQIYQNSGPRTVSVSFKMHREMNHITPIEDVVSAIEACAYPTTGNDRSVAPRVTLYIGGNCKISGIISGSVTANWSDTIAEIGGKLKYNMVELSFTVTECTGNPRSLAYVYGKHGVE